MATWGLVSTIKAPEDKVLAFVAHHLSLGAGHLWLFFDDPEAPIPAILASHPSVTVTRCDAAHWATVGTKRPPRHQNRQSRNARFAYRRLTTTDWVVHIDVDEFLHTPLPVSDILDEAPADTVAMKLEPFEAMHDPLLPDDIYTAREFRGALRQENWLRRRAALGPYRKIIPDGMLSHTVGKVIYRANIPGLIPRLHAVMLEGELLRIRNWHPQIRLLHFHAQDREAWLAALPFRMTKGAYQFRPELQAFLAAASPEEIDRFYRRTQILPVRQASELGKAGRVLTVDLGLRLKVQALLAGELG